MKRIILLLALVTCSVAVCAQTPSDRRYIDTVGESSAERPTYSFYADASGTIGALGRGSIIRTSYGVGARYGIALIEIHYGTFSGTAFTNEQAYLGGVSIPLSRKSSFEVLGGVSVMDGYAEGALLHTERITDAEFAFLQFITLGYGSKDRWRQRYELHALGTGAAVRLVLTGLVWKVMRLGVTFDARSEFKPNTTHLAGGVSVQLGSF